jgi:D-beta-D-heptose 7-phosphate kinase/D-beta-D-heptose 1-phosphate adenosyltransferase
MHIIIATGGFDPLHTGHINYLNEAKKLGDYLVVGVNSNDWLIRKKGTYFLDFAERCMVINSLKPVNAVLAFDDADGTACSLLNNLIQVYEGKYRITFANGGDRDESNTPETGIQGIEFAWNVGGGKLNSSSSILDDYVQRVNAYRV